MKDGFSDIYIFLSAVSSNKPVPVFPWHALVPFLTNTGPPAVTSTPPSTVEQPIEKQHQTVNPTSSPKKPSQSEPRVSASDARKYAVHVDTCTMEKCVVTLSHFIFVIISPLNIVLFSQLLRELEPFFIKKTLHENINLQALFVLHSMKKKLQQNLFHMGEKVFVGIDRVSNYTRRKDRKVSKWNEK